MNPLLSFLGGSAFRMIWGELSAYLNKRMEHQQEVERMTLQERLDNNRHKNDCERIRMQSELGIKEVTVQHDLDVDKLAAAGFFDIARDVTKPIGIAWVDAWNSCIRPLGATMALLMIAANIVQNGWVIPALIADVLFAFLGIYVADRSLGKRGK